MKVAIVGATGNVGSRLTAELIGRGHSVTAISRHPEKMSANAGVTAVAGDIHQPESLAATLAGHDVVVHALRFADTDYDAFISAVRGAGVRRLVVVGGAGSLEVAPGVELVDTPAFPAEYKPEALAGRDFLSRLRGESELEWTFLSPAAILAPGTRTGNFRLGTDSLLVAEDGSSHISMEDYVIALADELENPRHVRARFTVGY